MLFKKCFKTFLNNVLLNIIITCIVIVRIALAQILMKCWDLFLRGCFFYSAYDLRIYQTDINQIFTKTFETEIIRW